MFQAFLKPHERADVQAMYNLRTVAEIQELFGPKVSTSLVLLFECSFIHSFIHSVWIFL